MCSAEWCTPSIQIKVIVECERWVRICCRRYLKISTIQEHRQNCDVRLFKASFYGQNKNIVFGYVDWGTDRFQHHANMFLHIKLTLSQCLSWLLLHVHFVQCHSTSNTSKHPWCLLCDKQNLHNRIKLQTYSMYYVFIYLVWKETMSLRFMGETRI